VDRPITPEQYLATQAQLLLMARLVQQWDLNSFLLTIATADTVGPFLDPTQYMRGSRNMHFIEDLARAAAMFQQSVREACERHKVQLPSPAEEEKA